MQKPLPARPSLEQFKKQAKELVKDHRMRNASTFALIREFLPSLTGKTDAEVILFPFALHDAQSVIARQYGFPSWNQLRDHLETLDIALNRLKPESSVEAKFNTICRAREQNDYALFCSVMDETMRAAVPKESFEATTSRLAAFFKSAYTTTYMGEMIQGEHAIYFWRISAPNQNSDVLVRMGVKDDLVSGILFSPPFGGAGGTK